MKVKFWKVTTETEKGHRKERREAVWEPWADIFSQTSTRKPQGLEVLQEGDLAFEVRTCNISRQIRREILAHDATYEVEMEGCVYTIISGDYSRNDRAKMAFRASFTV